MIDAFTGAPASALLRWVAFVAASVTCGVTACHLLLRGSLGPAHQRPVAAMVGLAAWTVLLSAVGRMAQQALSFAGAPSEAWSMVGVLLTTPWGWAWSAQCIAAALLVLQPAWLAAPPLGIARTAWQVVLTGAIVIAPAFQGHAIGAPQLAGLAVFADILHLMAGGLWIGTLFVIMVALVPGRDGAGVARLITAFTPWALTSAATLGATGTFASWLHVQELPFLWASTYGRMVLLKVALVAVVAVIGAVNWRRLSPR
ncbi:MAG: CopD family protein, partial [Cytophagaceae bacterium]|nr:CopD family protein [Gemmatimonadaceae bacterium]